MILITGAFGQDGKILQKKLKNKFPLILVDKLYDNNFKINKINKIILGDLQDFNFIDSIISQNKITTIFNFATNSFVDKDHMIRSILFSRCNIFENIINSVTKNNLVDKIWILHPISSEIYGIPSNFPQNRFTEIRPINKYGLQKSNELLKCRYLVNNGFRIFHPILYNHESKHRSPNFFSKKIISFFKNFNKDNTKNSEILEFYNSESIRDFGYAENFIDAFLLSKENNIIGDEIFGTGISLSIREFIQFVLVNLKIDFKIKYNQNNMLEISHLGTTIARELNNDPVDLQRKFQFDGIFKNKIFNSLSFIGGEKLIKQLIKDEIKQ